MSLIDPVYFLRIYISLTFIEFNFGFLPGEASSDQLSLI